MTDSIQGSSWVIVADHGQAVFYHHDRANGAMEEEVVLECPQGQAKGSEFTSDRSGRSFDIRGKGRHALEKAIGPKVASAQHFSHSVAGCIKALQQERRMRHYTLIAAPKFLGELRKAVASAGCDEPDHSIDKDLVGHSADQILKLL